MSTVNKPDVAKQLAWFYVAIAIFIPILGLLVAYFTHIETPSTRGTTTIVVIVIVLGAVESIMLWILASIYRTRYILTEHELVLKATRLIGGSKKIPLKTIKSAERTLIPFGFKLFGASFYGGYYYLPSVGKAFMAITNFKDGVLIKTEHENYVITPKNPEAFIDSLEKIESEELIRG